MHTHEDDIVDLAGLEQIPDLDTGIADGIAFLIDAEDIDLFCPRGAGVEALCFEFFCPRGMLGRIVILSAVALIDRVDGALFGRDLFAPVGDLIREPGGRRRTGGANPCRGAFVGGHAAARGMDDEDAGGAGFFEHLVHARGHLALAGDGIFAMM